MVNGSIHPSIKRMDKWLWLTCTVLYWHAHVTLAGHNMSQTDGMSVGGDSGRGGHSGNTGTGCYKNHDHDRMTGQWGRGKVTSTTSIQATLGAVVRPSQQQQSRRQSVAVIPSSGGAVSVAAVTALLASSTPATNVTAVGIAAAAATSSSGNQPPVSNRAVDLGIV